MPPEKLSALIAQYQTKYTFEHSDLNKDGYLDRDEWHNRSWNFYLIADVDGDGKLNYAEHISLDVPITPKGVVLQQDVVDAERAVRRRDKNRDGFITSDEYRKTSNAYFDGFDVRCKKDGRISNEEYKPGKLLECH